MPDTEKLKAMMFKLRCDRHRVDNRGSNAVADATLLSEFSNAMENKMVASRQSGRFGWWDNETISQSKLVSLLTHAVADRDWVSVANYSAMIRAREAADGIIKERQ